MTRAEQFLEEERKRHPLFREGMTSQQLAIEEREVREWQDRHDAFIASGKVLKSDADTATQRRRKLTAARVRKHRKKHALM